MRIICYCFVCIKNLDNFKVHFLTPNNSINKLNKISIWKLIEIIIGSKFLKKYTNAMRVYFTAC